MKKIFLPLCVLIFSGIIAENSDNSQSKIINIKIVVQNEPSQELRKIHPSTVLQGMANSCNQLGKVAEASTTKEKQKETCNLIASFFQLAATVSKENEQKPVDKQNSTEQKENKEEKEVIKDQTVRLVLDLVNFINEENEKIALRSEPSIYLSMLRELPNDEAKTQLIEQILSDKKETEGFLTEVTKALKNLFFVTIPEITTNCIDSLKKFFNQ